MDYSEAGLLISSVFSTLSIELVKRKKAKTSKTTLFRYIIIITNHSLIVVNSHLNHFNNSGLKYLMGYSAPTGKQ